MRADRRAGGRRASRKLELLTRHGETLNPAASALRDAIRAVAGEFEQPLPPGGG